MKLARKRGKALTDKGECNPAIIQIITFHKASCEPLPGMVLLWRGEGKGVGQGDTGQGDTGQGDTGQGDTGQGDTGQGDTGHGDTGHGGTGRGRAGMINGSFFGEYILRNY